MNGVGIVFFALLGLLLPLALLGAIIAAVANARRRDDDEVTEPGIGTVRRLFLYGLTFVALIFAGVGLSLMLGAALDAIGGPSPIAANDNRLALALSFTIVGVPAWLALVFLAQRSVATHGVERRTQARRLYMDLVRGVALVVIVISGIDAARALVGVKDFSGGPWGILIAWGGIWALHQRFVAMEPAETSATRLLDHLYLYFGAALGLYVTVGGVITAMTTALTAGYDAAFRSALVRSPWSEHVRTALVVAAVGGAVWAWHWWHSLARRDALSPLWRVHVFLFGILSGVTLTIVPAAVMLHATLQWFIGEPGERTTAADHFDVLPFALSAFAAGVLTWGYHRLLLTETTGGERERSEPERIYRYVVCAAGLVTVATAFTILVALAVDVLVPRRPELFRTAGWWRNQLVLGITLVAVGAPLWARYWTVIRGIAARDAAERAAASRRVYLFGIFGASVLTLLVNLTIVLFQLLQPTLRGDFTIQVVRDIRWSLALVLTAGTVAIYHWFVLREDQREQPPAEPAEMRRSILIIAGAQADQLVRELGRIDGVRTRVWRRQGPTPAAAEEPLSPEEIAELHARVRASEHPQLALVVGDNGIDLIPYLADER